MTEGLSLAGFIPTIRLVLDSGGEFTLWPRGISMRPFITQGRDSVVLVRPPKRLRRGDIALYQRDNGSYVLHRVISCKGGSYTMCGDNQLTPEPGIRQESIIAVVSRINRRGKAVSLSSLSCRAYLFVWSFFPVRRMWFLARRCRQKLCRHFR